MREPEELPPGPPPPTDSPASVLLRALLRIAGIVIGTVAVIVGILFVVCYGVERLGRLRS